MLRFLKRRAHEAGALHRAARRVPLLIRVIAAGKVAKGGLFALAGLFAARIARAPDLHGLLSELLQRCHFDPDGERAHRLIGWIGGLPTARLRLIAAGLFGYAVIYLVEGIGLWFDRPWAEWLVAVATAVFIPFEIEHLVRHPGWGIALALAINLAVVAILVGRILARRRAALSRPGAGGG